MDVVVTIKMTIPDEGNNVLDINPLIEEAFENTPIVVNEIRTQRTDHLTMGIATIKEIRKVTGCNLQPAFDLVKEAREKGISSTGLINGYMVRVYAHRIGDSVYYSTSGLH